MKQFGPSCFCAALLAVTFMGASNPADAQSPAGNAKPGDVEFWEELAFWESIKQTSNPAELEAYLATYPEGRFRRLAEIRLDSLRSGKAGAAPPAAGAKEHASSTKPPSTRAPTSQPAAKETDIAAGSVIKDCDLCPELVVVPPGDFLMGSSEGRPEEGPPHRVTIAKPFAIGVYAVSAEEWDACLREDACKFAPDSATRGRLPVSNVSWDDARQYLDWLKRKTGKAYRLPTEAEWEYAAHAGTKTHYWWGNKAGKNNANCTNCGSQWDGKSAAPVGSFKPNPFGLYDVAGNVWEWTQDCANRSYEGAPTDGSAWLRGDCLGRMLRGGSWNLDAEYMRTTRRHNYDRDVRYYLNGFRVVRSLP